MPKKVLLIEDDVAVQLLLGRVLTSAGLELVVRDTGELAEQVIRAERPDVVLCDLMLPGRDGMTICRDLRAAPDLCHLPVVIMSSKPFESDKHEAMAAGASAYITKPFDTRDLMQALHDAMRIHAVVTVWGARGSIAAPEHGRGKYGGNTPCVSVALGGNRHIIFDAGTGLRMLGKELAPQSPTRLSLCLTHFHWDHIFGLPFFAPLYMPENEVCFYGPARSNAALTEKIREEMGGDYFPISTDAFRAHVEFIGVGQESFETLGVKLATFHAFHPRHTIAYRVSIGERSLVYAPDNEILPEWVENGLAEPARRFAEFIRGASLLIHDSTYSRPQFEQRRGWGHSCGQALAPVVDFADIERVLLFHHDPDNDDDQVDAIHAEFEAALPPATRLRSEPAREGASYSL